MRRMIGWALILAVVTAAGAAPLVKLNEADFRDKVYACWLGKNIGGTLGVPFEGKTEARDLTFYTNLKVGGSGDNRDTRSFNAEIAPPVSTDTVRLLIHWGANSQRPNAAQISELEVYGAE